jgi:hypothetical protein
MVISLGQGGSVPRETLMALLVSFENGLISARCLPLFARSNRGMDKLNPEVQWPLAKDSHEAVGRNDHEYRRIVPFLVYLSL